jgi:serine protease Do
VPHPLFPPARRGARGTRTHFAARRGERIEPEVVMTQSEAGTRRPLRPVHLVLSLCAAVLLAATPVARADEATAPDTPKPAPATAPAADRFFQAIVKVETRAVPDARSAASLGKEREGTGVVIDPEGLILTIGYLLVEADDVTVTDSRGRALPARIIGYDHATGLGLVRALVPLDAPPLVLGDASKLAEREPVMIANFGGADDVTLALVVSRRPFTANWEYMLDQAIFTVPAATNWSGAALVDRNLRLVGVGSLVVRDATGEGGPPGNMFVPIDALKPILADLVKSGRRSGPARPWLGLAADEVEGRLFVTRVSPDGPADKAGIKRGDIILGVNGEAVRTQAEFYRKLWGGGDAGTEIPLRLLQGVDIRVLRVKSIDRVAYFRPQTTY